MLLFLSPPSEDAEEREGYHYGMNPTRRSSLLWWTFFLGLIAACVVAILLIFAHPGITSAPVGMTSDTAGEFFLRSGASIAWYPSSAGSTIHAELSPAIAVQIPLNITEALPASNGLYPVLATMPTAQNSDMKSVFGIADTKGAFKPIDASGRFKEGLTADGAMVAYATFIPASGIATTGPMALNATQATSTGSWEIRVVDLTAANPKAVVLGQGSDPRFLLDGSILAFGSEGVVRIDPQTKVRTVVVPHAAGVVGTYAVSPDLAHFAVSDVPLGATTTVYALSADGDASVVGAIGAPLAAIGFSSNDELVGIYIASTTMQFYRISPKVSLERSAVLSIPSPTAP